MNTRTHTSFVLKTLFRRMIVYAFLFPCVITACVMASGKSSKTNVLISLHCPVIHYGSVIVRLIDFLYQGHALFFFSLTHSLDSNIADIDFKLFHIPLTKDGTK